MFSEKKIPSLIFHASFLCILIGAGLTRYWGFEGTMHIREGGSSDVVRTDRSFIWMGTVDDKQMYSNELYKYISELAFMNDFTLKLPFKNEVAKLSYMDYLVDARQVFKEDKNAKPLMAVMLSKPGQAGQQLILQKGQIYKIDGVNVSFLAKDLIKPYVNIDENLQLSSDMPLKYLAMSDGKSGVLPALAKVNAKLTRLYNIKDFSMVIRHVSMHAKEDLKGLDLKGDAHFLSFVKNSLARSLRSSLISLFGDPNNWTGMLKPLKAFALSDEYKPPIIPANAVNVLKLKLSFKGKDEEFFLVKEARPVRLKIDGQNFFIKWGPNMEKIPFKITLDRFELKRYSGSNSPSSYASYVSVGKGLSLIHI